MPKMSGCHGCFLAWDPASCVRHAAIVKGGRDRRGELGATHLVKNQQLLYAARHASDPVRYTLLLSIWYSEVTGFQWLSAARSADDTLAVEQSFAPLRFHLLMCEHQQSPSISLLSWPSHGPEAKSERSSNVD